MDAHKRSVNVDEGRSPSPISCRSLASTEVEQTIRTGKTEPARLRSPQNRRLMLSPIERSTGRILGGRPLPARLRGAVLALGNFDGFHLGHQEVALRAVELARSRGVAAILGTFDPHPASFFKPNAEPSRLTTLAQRQHLAAAIGIDAMLVFGFNAVLSAIPPEDFVQYWLAGLGGVVTGQDFRFGRGRTGNVELLEELCRQNGLLCSTVAPVLVGKDIASSTRIRAALKAGDCIAAARMLTRRYVIEGVVYPSRRMDPASPVLAARIELGDYIRPRCGTYAVRVKFSGGRVCDGSAYLPNAHGGPPQQELKLFVAGLGEVDFGSRIEVELIAHLQDAAQPLDEPVLCRRVASDGVLGYST